MLSVITTCRLNDVDPKAWLADVFARIADLPVSRLRELLPCWGGRSPSIELSTNSFWHIAMPWGAVHIWQWKTHKGTAIAAAA